MKGYFINSSSNNGNLGQIEEESDLNLHFVLKYICIQLLRVNTLVGTAYKSSNGVYHI